MKSNAHNLGTGCLILFALPFIVLGTGASVAFFRGLGRGGEMPVVLGIVGMMFAVTGCALIAVALTARRRAIRTGELREQHPGQPWMWNEEWASRRVRDSNRTSAAVLWVFAIFWNAVSWPVLLVLPKELSAGKYVVLVAAIFPVAGVILIGGAIRATMRAVRFQGSSLVLDHVPVPLGGTLHGRVEVPYEPLAEASSMVVRLTAVKRVRSGKSTNESIVSQEEMEIARGAVSRMPGGVAIPIAIDVPYDGPETQPEGSSQLLWRLTVDAEVPGIDFSASFDVPVFRTEVTGQAGPKMRLPPPEPLQPAGFVSKQTAGGRELYFGRFRARGMAMGMLFITLIWTTVLAVLVAVGAPWLVVAIFGLFELVVIWSTLDLFLGTSTIVLGRDNVVVRRSLFRTTEKVIRHDEIASAAAKIGGQGGGRPYYEIEVQTGTGKKIGAARYIRSKREAEWVAAQIRSARGSGATT